MSNETTLTKREASPKEKAWMEKETLASAYACEVNDGPEWCVSEIGPGGEEKITDWIRPAIEAEFVAMRMARLATVLGESAVAKKTKWHRENE